MIDTAEKHFEQDISRALDLIAHAEPLMAGLLREDIVRAAWMFAVGALDAFFCDAYADLLAKVLQARQFEPKVELPQRMLQVRVPVAATIRDVGSENWKWRMAARGLIEQETVLSLEAMRSLFNQFCRDSNKLSAAKTIESWMSRSDSRMRIFGITPSNFRALRDKARKQAVERGKTKMEERFGMIIQRRHDCIHNCDRPRSSIIRSQVDTPAYVRKVVHDVDFLAKRVLDLLRQEFPLYLQRLGFSKTTRNRVGV